MRALLATVSVLAVLAAAPAARAEPAAAGFPLAPAAAKGAPNILIVVTDDVGFAASSTFGGAIPTPAMDRVAAEGVRFNDFNTKAVCAPSRAALLTGRNPHAVGMGTVPETAVGEPGYTSVLPKSAATIAQVLKPAGYVSAFLGKHHAVPTWEAGPLGPFDHWARGLGFDYFYGFHGAWTDPFTPSLIEDEHPVDAPKQDGYLLDRDLADHAVAWLRMQRTQAPDRPFLLYYAPGTTHAPLAAPKEWIARFRGKFDGGWDVYRAEALARQKRLGLVPANTQLTPRPPGVAAWNTLSPEQKRLYARHMEVYAAALAYCDAQVARLLDELQAEGRLDNTIVIYIQGDNGASAEGGADGTVTYGARIPSAADVQMALEHLDDIGGAATASAPPAGWAVAMDTPFSYYKGVASRLGGIRTGMAISWPAGLKARGVQRRFVDIADIAPTLYELAGITPPAEVAGVKQQPLDGVSFADALRDPKAKSRTRVQYYELLGNSALYADGWLAATAMAPRGEAGNVDGLRDAPWQLYHLETDFSQSVDLAAKQPETLARLHGLFETEAKRNQVYPLQTSGYAALAPGGRPHPALAAGRYVFRPDGWRYPEGVFPSVLNRSWAIEADLVAPPGGGSGALVTQGGRFAGWGLVVDRGAPTFIYRTTLAEQLQLRAPELAPGPHKLRVVFHIDQPGVGRGGEFTLSVDGQPAAIGRLGRTIAFKFPPEPAGIGEDPGTPLLDGPGLASRYTGTLNTIAVELEAPPAKP
jgi:arylsulfatase